MTKVFTHCFLNVANMLLEIIYSDCTTKQCVFVIKKTMQNWDFALENHRL